MTIPINIQIRYFLATVSLGFFIGLFFDIYRAIRGFDYKRGILSSISDILFWILMSIFAFIYLLKTNNLNLRYYTFIGAIIGFIIYMRFISTKVQFILKWTVYAIIKILRMIIFVLTYPLKLSLIFIRYVLYELVFTIRRKK